MQGLSGQDLSGEESDGEGGWGGLPCPVIHPILTIETAGVVAGKNFK